LRVAALDLGTNTFLCLIADGDLNGIKNVLYDESRVVRLGQGLSHSGKLHSEALLRAENCLKEFGIAIEHFRPQKILALATSAARDASNAHLLFEIGKRFHIPIEIITGQQEAQMTYFGAMNLKPPGVCSLVIDVGGGSTEFILGTDSNILFSKSIDVGCVRLTEKFITEQPVKDSESQKLKEYLEKNFIENISEIKKYRIDQAIAVAGTPTSIVAAELGRFDSQKVHGFVLNDKLLEAWRDRLLKSSIIDKINLLKFEKGRADVIYVGSEILIESMRFLNIKELVVSIQGIRYGIAKYLLEKLD